MSLRIDRGEIVGIAGLVGAGRTELLEGIFGVAPLLDGTLVVAGEAVRVGCARDAIAAGIALAPEDRSLNGLLHEWTIRHNLSLADLRRHRRRGWLDAARELRVSRAMRERLRIGASGDNQQAGLLSGGNQQKVVLGRWLAVAPSVLLLDEPTRGVDVGARGEIYRIMEELAASGAAILFASSDLEEILAMSDRVLVMRDGGITGELQRSALSEEAIMLLATGTGTGDAAA